MIEQQLDELFPEMTLNKNSRARKKCLVVYLRKKGYLREEVAELLRIDEDTVTHYTKKYDESGLQGLLEQNYHQPKSQLEPRIQSSSRNSLKNKCRILSTKP